MPILFRNWHISYILKVYNMENVVYNGTTYEKRRGYYARKQRK